MKGGLSIFLWKLSVALYLIANGVLGLQKYTSGDFYVILDRMGIRGNNNFVVILLSVIALVAGILMLLEMFEIKVPIIDTLILIIAIVWVVFIVIEIISWITKGLGNNSFFHVLQMLAVHLMVLASLLLASKKFS
jgi:hypothetical protein